MSQTLEDIRVIDFTHDQAGPSRTQMLAWLDAVLCEEQFRGVAELPQM
jgi:crotonobetainyl-CoA:carnitine CoA-transferase CaiB-like acyl-CoA transferase